MNPWCPKMTPQFLYIRTKLHQQRRKYKDIKFMYEAFIFLYGEKLQIFHHRNNIAKNAAVFRNSEKIYEDVKILSFPYSISIPESFLVQLETPKTGQTNVQDCRQSKPSSNASIP